jgi:hypothetical protein
MGVTLARPVAAYDSCLRFPEIAIDRAGGDQQALALLQLRQNQSVAISPQLI